MTRRKLLHRYRYEVRKLSGGAWGLCDQAGPVQCRETKRAMVTVASGLLTQLYYDLKVRSELVIKRADGSIQDTRTYGEDPRRTRG